MGRAQKGWSDVLPCPMPADMPLLQRFSGLAPPNFADRHLYREGQNKAGGLSCPFCFDWITKCKDEPGKCLQYRLSCVIIIFAVL